MPGPGRWATGRGPSQRWDTCLWWPQALVPIAGLDRVGSHPHAATRPDRSEGSAGREGPVDTPPPAPDVFLLAFGPLRASDHILKSYATFYAVRLSRLGSLEAVQQVLQACWEGEAGLHEVLVPRNPSSKATTACHSPFGLHFGTIYIYTYTYYMCVI